MVEDKYTNKVCCHKSLIAFPLVEAADAESHSSLHVAVWRITLPNTKTLAGSSCNDKSIHGSTNYVERVTNQTFLDLRRGRDAARNG